MSTLLCIVGRHKWNNPKFSKAEIAKCSFSEFTEIFWETEVKCKHCNLHRSLRRLFRTDEAKIRGEQMIRNYYESVKGPESGEWHGPSQRAQLLAEVLAEIGLG